ncbi:hypothetical protein ACHHYP_07450 [Achlya hypogyna]|uniref:EF-hand domain-containing protein n=1 Tax=Achlya hypogyna TaxID=1202772 RepID=A0A1V9ZM65_ACHHY|nr:hypothetical protein ACHHYP_07450 [Achlya hypogyna]
MSSSKVRVHSTGSSNRPLSTPGDSFSIVPSSPRVPSKSPRSTPRFIRPTPPLRNNRDAALNEMHPATPTPPSDTTDAGTGVTAAEMIQTPTPGQKEAAVAEFTQLLRAKYECTKSLRAAFRSWDINHDGRLSHGEMKDMFTTMGWASQLGPEKSDLLIRSVLDPSSECVTYDAFCKLVLKASEPMHEPPQRQHILKEIAFGEAVLGSTELPDDTGPEMSARHMVYTLRMKYEKMKLGTVFRLWDQNKEGKLSLEIIEKNLDKQNIKVAREVVQDLMNTYDADKDGMLNFYEFANIMNGPVLDGHDRVLLRKLRRSDVVAPPPSTTAPPEDNFDAAKLRETMYAKLKVYKNRILQDFDDMDDDGSGKLTYAEFRHGLHKRGIVLSEPEFRHLAADMDTDHDGLISLWEFTVHLRKLIKMDAAKDFSLPSAPGASWAEEPPKPSNGSLPKFDFGQLRANVHVPTRSGRTPRHDTKELLCGPMSPLNPWRFADEPGRRFRPESHEYGTCDNASGVAGEDLARQRARHAFIQSQMAKMRQDERDREDALMARMQQREKAKAADHIRQRTQYYMRLKERAERDTRIFD